jgi:hypothetical protein
MKTLNMSTLFMPDELLPIFAVLLIATAGMFMMFGAKKISYGLMITAMLALACLAFEPLIAHLVGVFIDATPLWILALVIIAFILKVAGRFFRDVAVHVAGDLTSGLIRWTLTTRYGLSLLATLIVGGTLWARYG